LTHISLVIYSHFSHICITFRSDSVEYNSQLAAIQKLKHRTITKQSNLEQHTLIKQLPRQGH